MTKFKDLIKIQHELPKIGPVLNNPCLKFGMECFTAIGSGMIRFKHREIFWFNTPLPGSLDISLKPIKVQPISWGRHGYIL